MCGVIAADVFIPEFPHDSPTLVEIEDSTVKIPTPVLNPHPPHENLRVQVSKVLKMKLARPFMTSHTSQLYASVLPNPYAA